MPSFTTSEQRTTSVAFDKFIEATNNTLDDPVMRAQLGEVAIDLQQIAASAFLPNVRDGKFVVPKSQQGNSNLALVPLTKKQANNAYEITDPLNMEPPIRSWSAQEAPISVRYGLELSEELDVLLQDGPPGAANAPDLKGLRSSTAARTTARVNKTPDDIYHVSRPNLMVRENLLKTGTFACGAIVLHELVHASDLLEDGPLYGTLTYGVATELRAYHVGATVYKTANIDTPEARTSIWIDSIREQEIGYTDTPFTPNQVLIETMTQTGKV